jgi:hypothetical protein
MRERTSSWSEFYVEATGRNLSLTKLPHLAGGVAVSLSYDKFVLLYSLSNKKTPQRTLARTYSGILPKRQNILVQLNETYSLMHIESGRRRSFLILKLKKRGSFSSKQITRHHARF